MKRPILLLLLLNSIAGIYAQPPATPAPTVNYVPFEVNDDSSATLRIYAPNAKNVTLGGDLKGIKSERGADSVWTITTAPHLNPSAYCYFFLVDGMKVNDPKNPIVADFRPMVEIAPKNQTLFWQQKEVPHGLLSIVYYPSKAANSTRRMFVWTPPGYFSGTKKLPVLYLLHGGGDNDTNWPGQGKAGWILDNLFAENKIVPMIVVMPDGSIPVEKFAQDLGNDIVPYVENNFRAFTDAQHRAIAGLSMGGIETIETLLKFPDKFAFVNVMSSGWFRNRPCIYEKYGLKSELSKMEGGHSMYVWRHDLYNFSQKIFK